VIDALLQTQRRIEVFTDLRERIDDEVLNGSHSGRIVLVTAHRRENFDGGMERIAAALLRIVEREDVTVIFPVHPNPNVLTPMRAMLGDHPRIRLLPPQDYVPFVRLLSRCDVVLTDS